MATLRTQTLIRRLSVSRTGIVALLTPVLAPTPDPVPIVEGFSWLSVTPMAPVCGKHDIFTCEVSLCGERHHSAGSA